MKRKFVLVGLAALFLGFGEVAAQDIVARVAGLEENKEYMDLLDEWTLDVDGEKENCIQETREWFQEHGYYTVA